MILGKSPVNISIANVSTLAFQLNQLATVIRKLAVFFDNKGKQNQSILLFDITRITDL